MTINKIIFTDLNRAGDCIKWTIENIGPKTNSPGSSIRGEGWHFCTNMPSDISKENITFTMELNEHVDEETQLLFMLKWS
jgi:hypothetical protein